MRYLRPFGAILIVIILMGSSVRFTNAQQDAQRISETDALGGQVTAAVPLPGGAVLAASGERLLRLETEGTGFRTAAETDLNVGPIVDMVRADETLYVLTSAGITVLRVGSLQPIDQVQGGGQMMAVSQRHVAAAAREGGFRLYAREANGALAPLAPIAVEGDVNAVGFSPQGERLYLATSEGVRVVTLSDNIPAQLEAVPFTLSPAQAVTASGSLVAVAGENGRIGIYDGERAAQIGTYSPLQEGRRVTVRGEYAYIADAVDGLKIMLLASPDRPIQIFSEINTPAADLQLDGDIAIVAGRDSLRILDTASRYQPLGLGQVELPGQAAAVSLGEGRAFVALQEGGVAVVDVRNRSLPLVEQVLPSTGLVEATFYYDERLYAVQSDGSLAVYTLTSAEPVSVLPLGCTPSDIDRRGRVLYIPCEENGLLAVDVTRRDQPTLVGSIAPNSGDAFYRIDITGKRAYIAGGDHVTVVDVSQPQQMGRLARVDAQASDVTHSDVYFYTVGGPAMAVYDVRATAEPTLLRQYSSITQVADITASNGQILMSNRSAGADMVVISLATPASPFELAHIGTRGMTRSITASAEQTWLARGFAGLQQFDLTEGAPILVATYSTPPDAERLATDGGTIIAGGLEGWAAAEWLSQGGLRAGQAGDASGGVRDLAMQGQRVAVAYGERGVGLFQVADGEVQRVGLRPTVGAAAGVALTDTYLFVADAGGLAIYDTAFLTPITRVDLDLPALGIMLVESTAYLALADGSIAEVDVSQPTGGIRVLSQVETRRPATFVPTATTGELLTVSENGVLRLDTSTPDALRVIEQGALPEVATRGFFIGGLLAAYREQGDVFLYDLGVLADGVRNAGAFGAGGRDVVVKESTAYIAYGDGGLGITDIRQTDDPAILLGENVTDLLLVGDRLYTLGDSFILWDVTNPEAPAQIYQITDLRAGRYIAEASARTLLLGLEDGVALVEADSGLVRGRVPTTSPVTHVAAAGQYGLAALESGGVLVFEREEPRALFTLNSQLGRFATDIYPLSDERMLISWEGGLELIALDSLSEGPTLVETLPASKVGLTPQGGHFARDGARAALATGVSNTILLDLDAPSSEDSVISAVPTPGDALSAALDGDTLFVADGVCGLRVVDVSQPQNPQEVGYWRGNFVSDVASFGEGRLVVVNAGQLVSLSYDSDGSPVPPPAPQQPSPPDQARGLPGQASLMWEPASDPCNPLAYRIYLGVEQEPPLIGRVTGEPLLIVSDLRPSRTYNWRVEATDRQGDTVSGPLWQFTIAEADFQGGPPAPPTFIERLLQSPAVPVVMIVALAAGSLFALRYVRKRESIR